VDSHVTFTTRGTPLMDLEGREPGSAPFAAFLTLLWTIPADVHLFFTFAVSLQFHTVCAKVHS